MRLNCNTWKTSTTQRNAFSTAISLNPSAHVFAIADWSVWRTPQARMPSNGELCSNHWLIISFMAARTRWMLPTTPGWFEQIGLDPFESGPPSGDWGCSPPGDRSHPMAIPAQVDGPFARGTQEALRDRSCSNTATHAALRPGANKRAVHPLADARRPAVRLPA